SSAMRTWRASRSASEYTATVAMPIRLAVLMTRQAISPRLAMRSLVNIRCSSQRNVVVFLLGAARLLVLQRREGPDHPPSCAVGHDDVVDEAAFGGDEGVG